MNKRVDLTGMSIIRAKKGQASPASDVSHVQFDGSVEEGGHPSFAGTTPTATVSQFSSDAPESLAASSVPNSAAAIVPRKARERGEPRSPVTTRITYGLQDRLFRAATILGKSQQALIEEAIDNLLKNHNL
jgi:hypothetical protein